MRTTLILVVPVLLAACSSEPAPDSPEVPVETPPQSAATTPDTRLADWLRAEYAEDGPVLYKSGHADLDGDGKDEVLVYVGGPMLCGSGGCNLEVLKDDGTGFTPIGSLSVSQLPVGVLDSTTDGYRDLAVTVSGGGAPEAIMKVPFGGESYASNPTVAPATSTESIGTEVIADGELTKLD